MFGNIKSEFQTDHRSCGIWVNRDCSPKRKHRKSDFVLEWLLLYFSKNSRTVNNRFIMNRRNSIYLFILDDTLFVFQLMWFLIFCLFLYPITFSATILRPSMLPRYKFNEEHYHDVFNSDVEIRDVYLSWHILRKTIELSFNDA